MVTAKSLFLKNLRLRLGSLFSLSSPGGGPGERSAQSLCAMRLPPLENIGDECHYRNCLRFIHQWHSSAAVSAQVGTEHRRRPALPALLQGGEEKSEPRPEPEVFKKRLLARNHSVDSAFFRAHLFAQAVRRSLLTDPLWDYARRLTPRLGKNLAARHLPLNRIVTA